MKREVAELSGNFRGELSPPDGGEGIRLIFALCVNVGNARERVRNERKVSEKPVHVENKTFEPLVRA